MVKTLRISSSVAPKISQVIGGLLSSTALLVAFTAQAQASESIAQLAKQANIQIIPANPAQNSLPAPGQPTAPPSARPSAQPSSPLPSVAAPSGTESKTAAPLPAREPLVQPAAAGSTKNYTDELMSVDFPMDWEINITEDAVMVSNVTTDEASLVATQIARISASPGAVVDANIDSFLEEGATVGRYRTVTIDGQDALVIWLSERPGVQSRAIATFVGYGSDTVLLFTRYSPENEAVEEQILQLHTSFNNLDASADMAEVEAPEVEAVE